MTNPNGLQGSEEGSTPSENRDDRRTSTHSQKIIVQRRSSPMLAVMLGVLIAILLALIIIGLIGLNHLTAINNTAAGISAKVSQTTGMLAHIETQLSQISADLQAGFSQIGAELSRITAAIQGLHH